MRIIKSNNEIRKNIYNVSRPDHFGSIKKMPVRPEVADEREESQADMPYEEVKQKVAQYEQSKITPALEAQIRTLKRETGWNWSRGIRITIYVHEEDVKNKGVSTETDWNGKNEKPVYSTSIEDMGLMQEQDEAYEDPDRSSDQHYGNFNNAAKAMQEIYEEAGYFVKASRVQAAWALNIKRH
jgi:hypothetical protein